MFNSSTLTRGSPKTPNRHPSVCASIIERTTATGSPFVRATRGACAYAFAGEMCGSSPEADDVTASAGTFVWTSYALIAAAIESRNFFDVGHKYKVIVYHPKGTRCYLPDGNWVPGPGFRIVKFS